MSMPQQHPPGNPYQPPLTSSFDPRSAPRPDIKPPKPPIPGWAWVFVVACGIIPVLTLGGLLPIGIGIGGAAGCIGVARGSMPTGAKVGICFAITAACWLLVVLLVIGLALLQGAVKQ